MKTDYRFVYPQSENPQDSLQDEILQSVLLSVQSRDWMISIDLKDAYLQVPIHPDSCKYLRFMALNQVFQFKALCFGLSTAPQVFTRVMAPVSAFLHRLGIHLCHYLDNWLILASSRLLVLQALDTVLRVCQELGIVANWEKSNLLPAQRVVYLGVIIDFTLFRASPSLPRVEKLFSITEEFLSCDAASSWLVFLGVLSSLTQLVPGGRFKDAISAASASPSLGSQGRFPVNSLGLGLPSRSGMVVGSGLYPTGHFFDSSQPTPRLLVRRLGRGLWSLPPGQHLFHPVVSGGSHSV